MSVVTFPKAYRERVEVIVVTDKETGLPLYLFDLIEGEGRCIIHSCHSLKEAARVSVELLVEGIDVVWENA